MGKGQSLADFIRPHCAVTAGDERRYLRVKIGRTRTGRGSRVVDMEPIYLTGEIAEPYAIRIENMVARATAGELPENKLYYEILEYGGTHPLPDGISDAYPIPHPGHAETLDDSIQTGDMSQTVGHVMMALTAQADITARKASSSETLYAKRIEHLESMVVDQFNHRLKEATEYATKIGDLHRQISAAEQRATLAESGGGTDSDGMMAALEMAKEVFPGALAHIQAVWLKWQDDQNKRSQAKPEGEGKPTPGDEADIYMTALASLLQANHDILTQERYDKFKLAFGNINMLAQLRGLK